MEFIGYFKGHTEAVEGLSKSGNPWREMTGVFETVDKYPKTVAVSCKNAMVETLAKCVKGKLYRVRFDVESRSWKGKDGNSPEKWFTEAKAWGIQLEVPAATPGVHDGVQTVPATDNDDLPY